MPKLTIHIPNKEPLKIAFEDEAVITIGRAEDNDIVVEDGSMSGHHAKLELADDGYVLVDCDSTNGTFVNGDLVSREPLVHGAHITFGQVDAEYETEEGLANPETASAASEPAGDEEYLPSSTIRAEISQVSNRPPNYTTVSPFPDVKKKNTAGQLVMGVMVLALLASVALVAFAAMMKVSV